MGFGRERRFASGVLDKGKREAVIDFLGVVGVISSIAIAAGRQVCILFFYLIILIDYEKFRV